MGKQVGFYALTQDMAELEMRWRQFDTALVLVPSTLSTPEVSFVSKLHEWRMGHDSLRLFLSSQPFLPFVKVNQFGSKEVPSKWQIDLLRSPAIECDRCYCDKKVFRKGRLYFDASYYDEAGTKVLKDDAFLRWADSLFALTRKTFERDSSLDAYVGHHARAVIEQGSLRLE